MTNLEYMRNSYDEVKKAYKRYKEKVEKTKENGDPNYSWVIFPKQNCRILTDVDSLMYTARELVGADFVLEPVEDEQFCGYILKRKD